MGTDPLKRDTDGDGISDYDERWTWRTNPSGADSDNDGLPDGAELEWGCNPLDADTDGDRVIDGVEAHLSPKLDPVGYDGDGDGVCDYDAYWSGLAVAEEWNRSTLADRFLDIFRPYTVTHGFGDVSADYDGDGWADWLEDLYGTCPWDADVYPGRADGIPPKFRLVVRNVSQQLCRKNPQLEIDGHRVVPKPDPEQSYEYWVDEGEWCGISLLKLVDTAPMLSLSCDYGNGDEAKSVLEDPYGIFSDGGVSMPVPAGGKSAVETWARICLPTVRITPDPICFHGDETRETVACRILPEGLSFSTGRSDEIVWSLSGEETTFTGVPAVNVCRGHVGRELVCTWTSGGDTATAELVGMVPDVWCWLHEQTVSNCLTSADLAEVTVPEFPYSPKEEVDTDCHAYTVDIQLCCPDNVDWRPLPESRVLLDDEPFRVKIEISPHFDSLEECLAKFGRTLFVTTSATRPWGAEIPIDGDVRFSNRDDVSEIWISKTREDIVVAGLLPPAGNDGIDERCAYDVGKQKGMKDSKGDEGSNLTDMKEFFKIGMARRGMATAEPSFTLDSDPPGSKLDPSFMKAAGCELVAVSYAGVSTKPRQIMNQADYFYYSGHGNHHPALIDDMYPEDIGTYWQRELRCAVIAGCSVLDINDYNDNYLLDPQGHASSPGKMFERLGPAILLGYNYKAPRDGGGAPSRIVRNWLEKRGDSGDIDAWMLANEVARAWHACAIERNVKYVYFARLPNGKHVKAEISKENW